VRGARLAQKVGNFLRPPILFHLGVPDFKPDTFSFPPHLMIPKAPHFDALFNQETVSLFVAVTLVWKSVPAAVQLHCESCRNAKEIEDVDAARVLAAKLEFCKAPVAQQSPQAFFGVG